MSKGIYITSHRNSNMLNVISVHFAFMSYILCRIIFQVRANDNPSISAFGEETLFSSLSSSSRVFVLSSLFFFLPASFFFSLLFITPLLCPYKEAERCVVEPGRKWRAGADGNCVRYRKTRDTEPRDQTHPLV